MSIFAKINKKTIFWFLKTKLLNRYFLKIFTLSLWLLIGLSTFAQNNREPMQGGSSFEGLGGEFPPQSNNPSTPNSGPLSREEYRKKQDSIKAHAIKKEVKFWRLGAYGAYKTRVNPVDTSGFDVQVVNPFYKESIVNSFIGNTGGAYQSMIFVNRKHQFDFPFLQPYTCYLSRPETHLFIDTKTPYTDLEYVTGSRNNGDENILKVLFSRNVKKGWNVGVAYNLTSSNGQYSKQKQRNYNFTVFSSYEIGRYNLFAFLSHNRMHSQENGGLVDDLAIEVDTTVVAPNMEIRLNDAKAHFHNYNYYLSHQYNIGEKRMRVLEADSIPVYPLKLVHTIHWDKSSRTYEDKERGDDFYKQAYYGVNETINEELTYQSLKNTAQLVLNEKYFKWFKYGMRVQLTQNHITYSLPDLHVKYPFDFQVGKAEIQQDNLFFQAGVFYHSSEKTRWNAHWQMHLSGDRAGDTEAKFNYEQTFGTDSIPQHRLHLKFMMESKSPNVFEQHYFSNRIRWNNYFNKENRLEVGGAYSYKKLGFEAGGYYTLLNNYIYSGLDVVPQQYSEPISVITAFVRKHFSAWYLHFEPTVYYQQSSSQSVLPLPKLSLYANAYFEKDFFKKAIRVRMGMDGRYFSKWYAPAYFPASGQFHLQNEKEIGAFPKVDIYLIAKFKRASFFIKYEHANMLVGNKSYFSALHYPFNPNILKYGIRWYFYD